ncbi:hypothetical protein CKAH01_01075 [Colletotrichum kahawae]|uniref:Secreted protein n=1 Tax=Colletotrichum kahawae TaxID=34407 RepID=A0AAD9YDV2_COLKA|nr:hypothetical protein CKAH01_01075 [Colletotrichum kahawae]
MWTHIHFVARPVLFAAPVSAPGGQAATPAHGSQRTFSTIIASTEEQRHAEPVSVLPATPRPKWVDAATPRRDHPVRIARALGVRGKDTAAEGGAINVTKRAGGGPLPPFIH